MVDLSNVKKNDPLALVFSSGGSLPVNGIPRPVRAVKVFVKKRNPKSVVFEHEGKEIKVDLEGYGGPHRTWVELWDDKVQAGRERDQETWELSKKLEELQGENRAIPRGYSINVEDVRREPVLVQELLELRLAFLQKSLDICQKIQMSRS